MTGSEVVLHAGRSDWNRKVSLDIAHGVRLCRGRELPPLAWIPSDTSHSLEVGRFQAVGHRPSRIPVKPSGGLWTAPVLNAEHWEYGSSWTQWCISENFRAPQDGELMTMVVPDPRAVFLVIDTLDDLVAACRQWPRPETINRIFGPLVDWDTAAKSVDGIYLTEAGRWRTHFTEPGLYGWDVATVFFTKPSFTIGVLCPLKAQWRPAPDEYEPDSSDEDDE